MPPRRWQQQQMTELFYRRPAAVRPPVPACENGDLPSAQRWTAWLLACRETRELREEERNRGAAFARLLADWQPDCPPAWRICASKASSPAWPGSACAGKSRFPTWR
jgi:urease accessory protein